MGTPASATAAAAASSKRPCRESMSFKGGSSLPIPPGPIGLGRVGGDLQSVRPAEGQCPLPAVASNAFSAASWATGRMSEQPLSPLPEQRATAVAADADRRLERDD